MACGFTDYLADISQNTLQYATRPEKYGMWGVGLSYLNHGKFTKRDAAGNPEGEFSVNLDWPGTGSF